MALFQMGFSDHTSGSGSVYLRTADSGINKIEARAELLLRRQREVLAVCKKQTLTSLNASLLKLNITILSYTCSCFFVASRALSCILQGGVSGEHFKQQHMWPFNDASNTGSTRGNRVECKGIIQGHSDSALTLRGERQTAALLAAFVASDYRVECVYASPLGRASANGTAPGGEFSLFTDS